jgi:prefoldin subunit 4
MRFDVRADSFSPGCSARSFLPQHKATGARGEEIPVTWEDQQRINEFSRFNLQLSKIDDELKGKKNDAENLNDASTDIESLLDDDACKVRIGEVFMDVSNEDAEAFVKDQQAKSAAKLASLQAQRAELVVKMDILKKLLTEKFKNQINLENSDQTRDE